jgi:hypothetical protein
MQVNLTLDLGSILRKNHPWRKFQPIELQAILALAGGFKQI